ncbi:YHS domain-containing protein, partial [Azospirillum rugosum]
MTNQHIHHGHGRHNGHNDNAPSGAHRVTDPVCGMKVDPATSKYRADHRHETYHFCSARCRDRFVADPEGYLKPRAKPAAPEQAGHAS